RWLTLDTLEHLPPNELPLLSANITQRITAALEAFGCEASLQRRFNGNGGDSSEDTTPQLPPNEAPPATPADWVPALGLYKMRRTSHGYEAVAIRRPSSTGKPDQQRSRNLKIVPAGIRDFGAGVGYTPLELVMAALGCNLDSAFGFLSQRLG